jgi:hypothetical protein
MNFGLVSCVIMRNHGVKEENYERSVHKVYGTSYTSDCR